MNNTVIATVTNAAIRPVNRRDGTGTFPLHEVWLSLQADPYTARGDVYNQALTFANQQAEVVVRTVVNERGFTNHYLDYIGPIGGAAPQQAPQNQQPQFNPAFQAQQSQQAFAQPAPRAMRPEATPEERTSIHRQSAAKVAAKISSNPGEYWSNVNDLLRFFESGVTPMTNNANWTTGQAMATAQAGYQHGDEDSPF